MVVSKHDAAQALRDIDSAQQRTHSMLRYRANAPHFLLWGVVWLIANCICEFNPALGGKAWQSLATMGSVVSIWLSIRSVKQTVKQTENSRQGWYFVTVWLAILIFFIATFAVLPHLDGKQSNAYISLFWAFLYTLMGIWSGSRIVVVGILTTAAILVGYFLITTHYFLWMGVVTGGLLINSSSLFRKPMSKGALWMMTSAPCR
jgi:hypothetical protein